MLEIISEEHKSGNIRKDNVRFDRIFLLFDKITHLCDSRMLLLGVHVYSSNNFYTINGREIIAMGNIIFLRSSIKLYKLVNFIHIL